MSSEFTIGQGAGQKLEFAFQRNGVGSDVLEWLSSGTNLELVRLLSRGEAELIIKTTATTTLEPEVEADSIIRVDRSIHPSYPDWVKEVVHPELEPLGPAEYDITIVEQWLHDGQKGGKWIQGNKIYDHLKDTDVLKTCLGLRDLEEIQKKGIAFFRKHFKGKADFGWKSIVRHRHGDLHVPCLYENGDSVILDWCWTGLDWYGYGPALRLASSTKA